MSITDAQYCKNLQGEIISIKATIDGQVWHVPIIEDNTHYAAILEWKEEAANEIQAAE